MTNASDSPWTPEKVEHLLALHAAGNAFGVIAQRLGVSRCAVAGKLKRLGLNRDHAARTRDELAPRRLKRAYHGNEVPSAIARRAAALAMAEPEPLGDVDDGCRWLHGAPRERNFCGAPTNVLESYCPHHRARCYIIASVRMAA